MPPEALQGEELPSFALWRNQVFSKTEVYFPDILKVDEVHNVNREDWQSEPGKLIVNRVEVNGYLGLLFSSQRLENTSRKVKVEFHFHQQHGAIQSKICEVHLFRPLLAVKKIQKSIQFDDSMRPLVEVIQVFNQGIGTVIVSIGAEGDNIQLREQEVISQFRKYYKEDIRTGFAVLADRFPEYNNLLQKLADIWLKPIDLGDQEFLSRVEATMQDFRQATLEVNTFGKAVAETISEAILKNLHLFNIFNQLVDYLYSIPSRKVLLINPLDVIRVDTKLTPVRIKLEYTDLANNYYEPIYIDTAIMAKSPGDVPIYRLLKWFT